MNPRLGDQSNPDQLYDCTKYGVLDRIFPYWGGGGGGGGSVSLPVQSTHVVLCSYDIIKFLLTNCLVNCEKNSRTLALCMDIAAFGPYIRATYGPNILQH